jgi:hypothetical protein
MELFVTYADELSTVGGLVSVLTPVRSPPGTDTVVSRWSLLFLCTWPLAEKSFPFPGDSLALWPKWVFRMSCWEVVILVRRIEWDPCRMDPNSARALGHCRCTVCFNSAVWSLDWLLLSPNRFVLRFWLFSGVQTSLFLISFYLFSFICLLLCFYH